MPGKVIIFSAPSGSGKSTIIGRLMAHEELNMAFSISCTSRQPRGTERDGVEYFFVTPDEFRRKIADGEFLEYEEVYKDRYYGTLKSQVERQLEAGENVVLDVDVKGACNIKQFYGARALALFIQPPSLDELRRRLEGRGTDAPSVIEDRLARAKFELGFASKFDKVIVNDDLDHAVSEALEAVKKGMGELVRTGSVSSYFQSCVVSAGAKTGSAQTGDTVANGVFVCFAPFEDPEIAVAVVIEKGGSGSALASSAVRILNAWFGAGDTGSAVVSENTLLP